MYKISEILPFKDFVCIKVCHNCRVQCFEIMLVCSCLNTNRSSKELQILLCSFVFSKFELPNRGCGPSTGAAYTRNCSFAQCTADLFCTNSISIFMGGRFWFSRYSVGRSSLGLSEAVWKKLQINVHADCSVTYDVFLYNTKLIMVIGYRFWICQKSQRKNMDTVWYTRISCPRDHS